MNGHHLLSSLVAFFPPNFLERNGKTHPQNILSSTIWEKEVLLGHFSLSNSQRSVPSSAFIFIIFLFLSVSSPFWLHPSQRKQGHISLRAGVGIHALGTTPCRESLLTQRRFSFLPSPLPPGNRVFDLPRRHFTLNLDASASKRPHFPVPKFPIVDQSRYEDYTPALPTIRASRTTLQSFRLHTEQMLP